MKFIIFGLLIQVLPGLANAVDVKRIDLFLNSDMKIQNKAYARDVDLHVHYVDSVEQLEAQISRDLPNNPGDAARILKQQIQDPEFNRKVGRAYLPALKAKKAGINRVPAAVINNVQGVIYGSTDITRILTAAENVED